MVYRMKARSIIPQVGIPNDDFTLYHGDFFNSWKDLPRNFDLILTDPPYNILQQTQSWDKEIDFKELEYIFDEILKPFGLVIIFCDLNLMLQLMTEWTEKLNYKHYHIWKKTGGMPVSKKRPINNAEFILVFRKAGIREKELTFNPFEMGVIGQAYFKRNSTPDIPTRRMKKTKVNINKTGKRFSKVIIEAPNKPNMERWERSNHPTQKPEILLRKLIRGYSNKGGMILDPFAGSGSTIISSLKEERQAIGFEKNEDYFNEAEMRINGVIKQENLFR